MPVNSATWSTASLTLASTILFGASTPVAKLLLGNRISPWLLAGLLYLGSGIGLAVVHLAARVPWPWVKRKRLFGVPTDRRQD